MNISNISFTETTAVSSIMVVVVTFADGTVKTFVEETTIPTPEPAPEIPKITVPLNTPIELVA